jgi:hypothetical protein
VKDGAHHPHEGLVEIDCHTIFNVEILVFSSNKKFTWHKLKPKEPLIMIVIEGILIPNPFFQIITVAILS